MTAATNKNQIPNPHIGPLPPGQYYYITPINGGPPITIPSSYFDGSNNHSGNRPDSHSDNRPDGVDTSTDSQYGPRTTFAIELNEATSSTYPIFELRSIAQREFDRRMDLEFELQAEKLRTQSQQAQAPAPQAQTPQADPDIVIRAKEIVNDLMELKAILRVLRDNLFYNKSNTKAERMYQDHPLWLPVHTRITELNRELNKLGMDE